MKSIYTRASKSQEIARLETQARVLSSVIDKEVEILGLRRGIRVLDAGCGTGAVARMIAQKIAPSRVYAVDIDHVFINEAKTIAKTEGISNITFQLQNIEDLKYTGEMFDVSYCRFVLSHVRDPFKAVSELKRVTRKDGTIASSDEGGVFTYPYMSKFEQLLEKYGQMRKKVLRGVEESLSNRDALSLFVSVGLNTIKAYPIPIFASQENPGKLKELTSVPLQMLEIEKNDVIEAGFVTNQDYEEGVKDLESWRSHPAALWMFLSILTVGKVPSN